MTKNDLEKRYFDWMYGIACQNRYSRKASYKMLLSYLNCIPFSYTVLMDRNRAADGVDLRYRFGYEQGYEDPMIASYLDDKPCSVLEMMVALAIRCEEHIMEDSDIGDRTGKWFWYMISSLGLSDMDDDQIDYIRVDRIIRKFLNREYTKDGKGGLFYVKNCKIDMRTTEVWYQMFQYLEKIL